MHLTVERHHFSLALIFALLVGLVVWRAPWSAQASQAAGLAQTNTSNVAVDCGPGQQALVRQAVVNRETQVNISCASGAQETMVSVDEFGRAVSPFQPVAYSSPAVYTRNAPMTTPLVTQAPARAVRTTRARTTETPTRSWKKSALIIGGSAGTGAGVGGLIGGKKGALIGTAIGGGSAALYEAVKRH